MLIISEHPFRIWTKFALVSRWHYTGSASDQRLSALMDSDLAWVNGKNGRQS